MQPIFERRAQRAAESLMENESLTESLDTEAAIDYLKCQPPKGCFAREEEKQVALRPTAEAFHLHSPRARLALLRRFHPADHHVFFVEIESIMTM